MRLFYLIGVRCYGAALRLASVFNSKARLWVDGRRNWPTRIKPLIPAEKQHVWFHCASLGEFEQARPLLEKFDRSRWFISLSFFSPSGYEIRKNFNGADHIFYLPMDGPATARLLLDRLNPDLVFFVKYEFWFFILKEIHNRQIPLYLVSARFRSDQLFFRSYGKWFRQIPAFFTHIFAQDQASLDLLHTIGIRKASRSGDTRFDRVLALKEQRKELPLLEKFVQHHPALIAGSCWPPEEELVAAAQDSFPDWRWVLVPHEVGPDNIRRLQNRFMGSVLYSELESGKEPAGEKILIVDRIGLLGNSYPYGRIALVGGGFRNALHNILEAAVWGIPVLYGNNCPKYPEAADLEMAGGGLSLSGTAEFCRAIQRVQEKQTAEEWGQKAGEWVQNSSGALENVISVLRENGVKV